MQTKTIKVSMGDNPMDSLKHLGDVTGKAWIFMHESVIDTLKGEAIKVIAGPKSITRYQDGVVSETDGHFDIILKEGTLRYNRMFGEWFMVYLIEYPGIAFTAAWKAGRTPTDIYMLEMKE